MILQNSFWNAALVLKKLIIIIKVENENVESWFFEE